MADTDSSNDDVHPSLIDLNQSNASYFSRNSTFQQHQSVQRSSTVTRELNVSASGTSGGPPGLAFRSRGVSDSYNISYASLHKVIQKSDFQAITPEILHSQKTAMQAHNSTLSGYAARNNELNAAIAKKIDQLKEYRAKRMADGDANTAEARRHALHLKKNTNAIEIEMKQLSKKRTSARAIEVINDNLRGDISNYERRIEETRERIQAIQVIIDRCDQATEEDQGQLGHLEREVEAKKLRAQKMEDKRQERMKLIAQLVSGTELDVDLSKILDGDFTHEHLVIEMKRLRELAMKEAHKEQKANEMVNDKIRLEYQKIIKATESLINEYNALMKAYHDVLYAHERGADEIKILKAKIVAIEERIREIEAESENSEELVALQAQIEAKMTEVKRLEAKFELEMERKKELILQIEGRRQKLDPELREMNTLLKSMTISSQRRHYSSTRTTITTTTTRPRKPPGSASSESSSD